MKRYFLMIAAIALSGQSCHNTVNPDKEKEAIMVIHNEQRKAHMEKNPDLLLRDVLQDYIEVNRGVVRMPTHAESFARFESYFNSVDFLKWDDEAEPVFSFSDDGTMASTVVQKLVVTRDKTGSNRIDTAHYAWLAVYRKVDGKWGLQSMASTNK